MGLKKREKEGVSTGEKRGASAFLAKRKGKD